MSQVYTVIPSISYMYMRGLPCGIIHTEESMYVTIIVINFSIML